MRITLVGIGMGNPDTLTAEGREALLDADVIIGAARMLEGLPEGCTRDRIAAVAPQAIADAIEMKSMARHICVAFSGDVGFYSGAKNLYALLEPYPVETVCGVTTVQYFCARLKRPWQNMRLLSGHGREVDVVAQVSRTRECFFLTGGEITPMTICRDLTEAGLGHVNVTVGEMLSYAAERITADRADRLLEQSFDKLSAVIVDNDAAQEGWAATGLEDGLFLRGKTPMTKQEVRSVLLAKLKLAQGDVAWDVGAGTGSVSIEMGRLCSRVYAIETEEEACGLIRSNIERFGVHNVTCIEGMAPEALRGLPRPDVVFIGGSKGNLEAIVAEVAARNPGARVAVTAIAVETLGEAARVLGQYGSFQVTQVAVSRSEQRGRYHMMRAENPIWILSGELGRA